MSATIPRQQDTTIDSKTLAKTVAEIADEKKAEDIEVIEVGEQLQVTDYFVVISGQNRNHVRALYNELHVRLKAAGEVHRPVEGADMGWWIVMDFVDVVVHLFQPEARAFYDLERLYADCPRIDWREGSVSEQADAS